MADAPQDKPPLPPLPPVTISRRKKPLKVPLPRGVHPNSIANLKMGNSAYLQGKEERAALEAQRATDLRTREGMLKALREIAANRDADNNEVVGVIKILLASMGGEEHRPPPNVVEWINQSFDADMKAAGAKVCAACHQYVAS